MRDEIGIDIETYSSVSLKTSGVYKYVESPDFEVLLFAYKWKGEQTQIIDLKNCEMIPEDVLAALTDKRVKKTAHNAAFERVCLTKWLGLTLHPGQWHCTMVKSAMAGLPQALEQVSMALRLTKGKLASGSALIKFFCIPCAPTKRNGGRTRNLPEHDPVRWQEFKTYCIRDVDAEDEIKERLSYVTTPQTERMLWALDQIINDGGLQIDPVFIKNCIRFDQLHRERLTKEAVKLTELENPNSVAQLKDWLWAETGETVAKLDKHVVASLLKSTDDEKVKKVLKLRQEMSKSSVRKYKAIVNYVCVDNRCRGLLQFCGAGRTWRWAGRGPQVHNLTKHKIEDSELDIARAFIKDNDIEALEWFFGNVLDMLSQVIRTAFVPKPGCKFLSADFRAIEARVLAWLAGEKWRLDVFRSHGKIYEASASHMFKVPLESVTKKSPLRNKGKMAELALGYQGGPAAIIRIEIGNMTPEEDRIPEEELPALVRMWRNANPKIKQYWYDLQDAAIAAIENGGMAEKVGCILFYVRNDTLYIELPSGRNLSYYKPRLSPGKFGLEITYEGLDDKKKWVRITTYGGKLTENIVQAISRDILADAMLRLHKAGYKIPLHVHDEVVLEVPEAFKDIPAVDKIMSQPIPWAPGLPLGVESGLLDYYRKD